MRRLCSGVPRDDAMNETNGYFCPAGARTLLSDGNAVYLARIPHLILPDSEGFERLWRLHPVERPEITIHGKPTIIPRWQQAYGRDYHFSGIRSAALPVADILRPYLDWARTEIHPHFNGLLLNWYDGSLGHYIGAHHDQTRQLVVGSPISSVSLGERRIFRLTRHVKRDGKMTVAETHDLDASSGSAITMTWATNLVWKHSVPKSLRFRGRRISITFRVFAG